jgi:inorganic phosphate transporter, PiT family
MTLSGALLLASALAFALASGANDGATLVAMGTRTRVIRVGVAIATLTVMVAVGPLLVGTAVATTLVHRLVSFESGAGQMTLLAAVAASLIVVLVLTRRGTPTSLTLALTGGIVGAGLGASLPVQWPVVGEVLAVALAAPLISVPTGWVVYKALSGPIGRFIARRSMSGAQVGSYLLQSVAYSANDAQKMVAIATVAAAAQVNPVRVSLASQAEIAVMFVVGIILSIRKVAPVIADGVVRIRTPHFLATSFSSAVVVLATSAVGAPVSSTQSAAGAAVGSGVANSPFGVRWTEVRRIGWAWIVTLPASIGLAAALAVAGRIAR